MKQKTYTCTVTGRTLPAANFTHWLSQFDNGKPTNGCWCDEVEEVSKLIGSRLKHRILSELAVRYAVLANAASAERDTRLAKRAGA